MLRKILATAILVVSLHAETEKFQVIANNLDSKNDIVVAKGDVVIFSKTYYMTAKKVIYNKKDGTFELFDDVIIVKDNNVQTKSKYAFLDTNKNDLYIKPNLLLESSSDVWINSKDAKKKNDVVNFENSILSSCDCVDPAWSIRSSSTDYDTKDQWVNTYNTALFFKDVPVFYTPYFGFSTNTTRRTGLLIPTVGFGSSEGFYYTQSLFVAPAPNYDFEFTPQVRTNRGNGMYAYARYADSSNSIFKFGTGYFKEKESYKKENKLRNKEHYGFTVDYERYNLFAEGQDNSDGLFVDINYLNDIEYRNLEKDNSDGSDKNVESKINYFFNTPSYYLGSYFKYFIDTQKESNSNTLQELPKLQAHTYSRPVLFDKLLVGSDLSYINHSRKEGLNADQYILNIPISYSWSLFDDYINLILKHEITANKYNYTKDQGRFDNGTYSESNTSIGLSSSLIKPYEDFIHTVNLSATYNNAHELKKDGDLYQVTNTNSDLSPFSVSQSSDNINLKINQSFYDRDTLEQIINHKLSQSIIYDEFDDPKLQNLENEITYNYLLGTIKNKVIYNHEDDKLIESSSSFSLNYENFYLKIGHYLSKDTPNSGKEDLASYTFDTGYKISKDYTLSYYTNYNIEESLRSKQGFKLGIYDRCWDLDIKFEREIEASSTTDNRPIEQDMIYFTLFLKPIGGIKQSYEVNKDDK